MKLLLFDVDGTLCESGKIISNKIANTLNYLIKNNLKIGIVGGGTHDKILLQLNNTIYPEYIFSECGSVYHFLNKDNNSYTLINKNNLRLEDEYIKINSLVKTALQYISQVSYFISGNFIDLRNGLIYISLVGMSANDDERTNFIELDKIHKYRNELIDILQKQAIELEINDYIEISLGGSVGIAVYPKKWNKIQVLNWLSPEITEIHFFGDKYLPGGNDYELINSDKIIPHCVDSPDDTFEKLHHLLNNLIDN